MKGFKTWTVQISVADVWIKDGFELEEENLKDAILSDLLGYATSEEVKVEIKRKATK